MSHFEVVPNIVLTTVMRFSFECAVSNSCGDIVEEYRNLCLQRCRGKVFGSIIQYFLCSKKTRGHLVCILAILIFQVDF